jgi:putative glutamine amidotransferase
MPDAPPGPPTRPPRILITRAEDVPRERWDDNADRVRAAGGDPTVCDLADWLAGSRPADYEGLILTGGIDVDPARYGEDRSEYVPRTTPQRDAFEIELLEASLARGVPVLAICRGHQLFNVAHGGRLIQHLAEREPHRSRRGDDGDLLSGWHDVEVREGTLLASAVGIGRIRVNSRHHQAVPPDGVAPGLVVAAVSPDGIVEALEHPAHRWAVSVQWHPERREMDGPESLALFAAFVRACSEAVTREG